MTLDVAARLAAGRPSVTNTQTYVTACHAVGYQHPDLTAHPAQIVEWFGNEDGLDLTQLDADCAALRAASAAADDAVRASRDGLAALTAAWDGESGSMAIEFVDRHCAAGLALAGALRAAAAACEALRDGLSRLVDEKVGAAVSIDDRRAGERPVWLAAAATVSGGGAEVVTHQIVPYVDADIRIDWLTAMRSATSSVSAAYEDALRQLNAAATVYFEVPGAFGSPPPSAAPAPPPAPPPAPAPVTSPAAVPLLPPPVTVPEPTVPLSAADPAPAQPLPPPPLAGPPALDTPASAGIPAMPTMPDVGGGLSGLVGQIADALGGLFDSMPDDAVANDMPEAEDSVAKNDPDNVDVVEEPASEHDPAAEEPIPEEVATEEMLAPDAEAPEAEPPPPPPPPEPVTAPVPPPPVAEQPDGQTPCEIAADELPQVGQ
ncbi:hypothetical protein [Mycobacterium sp. EPa45]|uniref:hypothetical protein n=1 Tax=Mycobacterium sp. EPa45 TaxID=1545728 RepID=UPI0006426343|nr:hypothetical protein [Mycobacterium sp. EPa45]AKK26448.1 hypothetical protein AB431_06805 [Mycobacterium sp. EPa45]